MAEFEDHYETLGVTVDADATTIRRAFRLKVREMHPDVAADKANANEAFIRLREAYAVLSDPGRRTHYDLLRANHRARARDGARRPTGPGGVRDPGASSRHMGGAPGPQTGRASGGFAGSDTWDAYHRNLSVAELLQRAMQEIAAGRLKHAGRDLSDVLAREPENPDALVLMGRLYRAEGRVEEWVRVLEDGVRKNPRNAALRLALNEARKAAEARPAPAAVTEELDEGRHRAYLAGGILSATAAFAWGFFRSILGTWQPFALHPFVSPPTPLVWGTMLCAFITGWTMAATQFIAPVDEELFFPDTHGRSLNRKNNPNDAPLGLAVPAMALIHYFLAVSVSLMLMVSRSRASRSLLIVSGAGLGLALMMALAYTRQAGEIMFWCSGWLLFAVFVGWFVGDFFRP